MKKAYVKPSMESEAFVPNTYVAACGDSGVTYYFECNAGEPYRYWQPGLFGGGRWVTDDHPYRVVVNGQEIASNYGPCNATHIAESDGDFSLGYIDNTHTPENENIPVVVWRNWEGGIFGGRLNTHCTTNLNKEEWQTAKS